jgi:hypothetical protein
MLILRTGLKLVLAERIVIRVSFGDCACHQMGRLRQSS